MTKKAKRSFALKVLFDPFSFKKKDEQQKGVN